MNLINQWQPMGVRVVLNIPFIGNDRDFLFAIRNGPFIPRFDKVYKDAGMYNEVAESPDIEINSYAFNNMKNVLHATKKWKDPPAEEKESIFITYYDYPPVLAQLATMFRKWRGSMEYRIRTISGFSTQGYLFAGMLRNSPSYTGVFNQYKVLNSVARQDDSYREVMQNSYIMSDTSMFRHFKIHVPYEYPSPWYDQYKWIGNRSRPAELFQTGGEGDPITAANTVWNEPHGDNFIVVGMRGSLNTSVNQAQISFELEYRAGEDFQFADPGLPIGDFLLPASSKTIVSVQYPDKTMESDGIGLPKKVATRTTVARSTVDEAAVLREQQIKLRDEEIRRRQEEQRRMQEEQRRRQQQLLQANAVSRATDRVRPKREIDEGIDTVDNFSDTSDVSQLSDFEGLGNMRKSLRTRSLLG
jgi:hypothetical protein